MNPDQQTSDAQSNGFLGLLGSLGQGYFSLKTAEAQAEAQANASRTSLNSTGSPVVTAPPAQWVPGVDNKTVVISAVVIVGALAAFAILRK